MKFKEKVFIKYIVRFLPFICLTACSSVNIISSDTNHQQFVLTCSEFNNDFEDCKNKANAVCDNHAHLIEHVAEVARDSGDGFYVYTKHHFLIECQSSS